MNLLRAYLWNLLVAVDQLLNTVAFGDPDETISSRMAKAIRANCCRLCHVICWVIGKFDPNHCAKSVEDDEGKDGIIR